MIPRMTVTGSLKGYRYNLQRSTFTLNKAITTVMTGRAFNSFAEDPAAAAKAFLIADLIATLLTVAPLTESTAYVCCSSTSSNNATAWSR